MQKKLIALAIAAAVSAPAFADNSNVTVYGKINADFENVNDNSLATSRSNVASNASRFGVKGSEDLGDGLSAIWQLEAQYNTTNNTTTTVTGATPAAAGTNVTVANGPFDGVRNSHVGLKGDFGTLFLGTWDSPFKVVHNKVELFDNAGTFTATKLVGLANGQSFNTRQSKDFQYWTPNLNGFEAKLSYSPDSAQSATQNKTLLSMSGAYENELVYAGLGYETRKDRAAAGANDSGTRFSGAIKFDGAGQVGLTYEHFSIGQAGGAAAKTQNNVELSGIYKFGNSNLGAFYAKNGNLGGVANTGAKQASLRYGYNFSKRTELYAAYTTLRNDTGATYNLTTGTAAGSRIKAFGLGMIHNF